MRPRDVRAAFAIALLCACERKASLDQAPKSEVRAASIETKAAGPAPRPVIDGRAFPDKVLALTWDDGPDMHTIELARFLKERHVVGTFFVNASWIDGVSSDPGFGKDVYRTGYEKLPVLADVVALGHRLGNHTLHHVLLSSVDAKTVEHELGDNQDAIDPFLKNELRLFRAPGGAWNAEASRVVDETPRLARIAGPVHWDIDRKDWEGSVYCRASDTPDECEAAAPDKARRLKPSVVAKRYLETIESQGHGVVLMHDRTGHVGSRYALDIAHILIPELEKRGYVFAAPVLHFGSLSVRVADDTGDTPESPLLLRDVNGDGHADVCEKRSLDHRCALATTAPSSPRGMLHTSFGRWNPITKLPDARARTAPALSFDDATMHDPRFCDLNGDGHTDVCGASPAGIVCAFSIGAAWTTPTVWITSEEARVVGWNLASAEGAFALGDINGDGRDDICGRGSLGVVCGLSP